MSNLEEGMEMKIAGIKIRNYRTVRGEVSFDVPNIISIVGPNNSGKSNIARAIEIFFSGRSNNKYDPALDMPFGIQGEKTSITVSFRVEKGSEWDDKFLEAHDQLRLLHVNPPDRDEITQLNLYFNDKKPVYQFFGNIKRPKEPSKNTQYSRVQSELIEMLFDHFKVYYVPSAKSFSDIFNDFIFPELKSEVNPKLVPIIPEVNKILSTTSESINKFLDASGLVDIKANISISKDSIDSLVSRIDFMISDSINTEISRKGTGIQSAAIFAALRWIDERKRSMGNELLWIVEEPESYLHPELTRTVNKLISMISESSTVIVTTHSLSFVPKTVENILGCEASESGTSVSRFHNFNEATLRIRRSIGVKFSDYYNLAAVNVGVEGKSDRSIFEAVLNHMLKEDLRPDLDLRALRDAKFITFGGVRELAEFVRVTYENVSKECVFLTILDGDDAGVKARKELQGYFGNRKPPVQFDSNRQFISVRSGFPIEGLFPDWIVQDVHKGNPSYFKTYSEDALGDVEPFQINDAQKSRVQDRMLEKLIASRDVTDFERFVAVFQTMNDAIVKMKQGDGNGVFS